MSKPKSLPRSILAGAGLVLLAAPAAPAAAQAPPKIAVVDTERILLESQTGKQALAELKKLGEQKETELRGRAQELRDLQVKISEGRLSLAEDKLAELSKQYEDKEIALRRLQDDAKRELDKRRDTVLAQIDAKVMPVLNQIGAEGGYALIFRKFESGLIYADEALDITASVIQRLDGGGAAN